MRSRDPKPGELDELRRLNRELAKIRGTRPVGAGNRSPAMATWRKLRDAAVTARAREVRRLRDLTVEPWSLAELAGAFRVTRGSIQRWADPSIDAGRRRDSHRRRPGTLPPPSVVWIPAAASLTSCGIRHLVCQFCHRAIRLLVG